MLWHSVFVALLLPLGGVSGGSGLRGFCLVACSFFAGWIDELLIVGLWRFVLGLWCWELTWCWVCDLDFVVVACCVLVFGCCVRVACWLWVSLGFGCFLFICGCLDLVVWCG